MKKSPKKNKKDVATDEAVAAKEVVSHAER
jgi:hypothetical protein